MDFRTNMLKQKISLRFLVLLPVLFLMAVYFGCGISVTNITPKEQPPGEEYIRIPEDVKVVFGLEPMRYIPPIQVQIPGLDPKEELFLYIRTDIYGYVENAAVLYSPHKSLSEAVLKAARRWVFEPLEINGTLSPAQFAYGGIFLKDQKNLSLHFAAESHVPNLIRKPPFVYPIRAKRRKIRDVIVADAVTDIYGRTIKINVIRGKSKILKNVVRETLSRWVHEPYIISGIPRRTYYTVVVRFPDKKGQYGIYSIFIKTMDTPPQLTEKQEEKEGKRFTYFENGEKKYEESFENKTRHGVFYGWYQNGAKRISGEFYHGVRYGKWTRWYENGNKIRETNYDKNGKKHGNRLTWWDEKGQRKRSSQYQNGVLHGKWLQWDKNGEKRFEGEYREGNWIKGTWWAPDGRLIHQITAGKTGYVNSSHLDFRGKGRYFPHYKGKPFTGRVVSFSDGVLYSEEEFKDGIQQGESIFWDANGNQIVKKHDGP